MENASFQIPKGFPIYLYVKSFAGLELFVQLIHPRVAQRAAKGKESGFAGTFNPLAWRLSGENPYFRKRR
jgi:hypothetical protein